MDHNQALSELRDALAAGDPAAFERSARALHPLDVAEQLQTLPVESMTALLATAAPALRAMLFSYLSLPWQLEIAGRLGRAELAELFVHMSNDERADLFNALPANHRELLLPALAQAEREDIRRLSGYAEDSVGAVMTSDYATLAPMLSAAEAIESLRDSGPTAETIYDAYVIDDQRRLIGAVTLRDLILARPRTLVAELMRSDPVAVYVDAPPAEAANLIARYDLLALPVLDRDERLVGIVTHDDAMDVAEAEATEDFHKAGGAHGALEGSLRHASVPRLYRLRVVWLVLLVFGNLFSGAGIAHFEDTIAANLALLFFLPLLIASAGNAGSQASTLMVRGLATGDVQLADWSRMLARELLIAALLGLTMAAAISAIGVWRGGPEIALVVAITMVLVVVAGSMIGMSLPFVLSRLRLDPAAASGPLVTSIADIAGVLIYFGLASVLLSEASG